MRGNPAAGRIVESAPCVGKSWPPGRSPLPLCWRRAVSSRRSPPNDRIRSSAAPPSRRRRRTIPTIRPTPIPTEPDTTEPTTSDPDDPDTTGPAPSIAPNEIDAAAINFGSNKTPHEYDDFLLAVMTDLDQWWSAEYPGIYGGAFESLSGGTYAAYPGRPDDLPGCGEPRTTYEDVQQFVAFYCGEGDFIIYDDGDDGLLAQLAAQYGPGTIGIVSGPRVRPRDPDTGRSARSCTADHLHRAAGRLLRRRLGGTGERR